MSLNVWQKIAYYLVMLLAVVAAMVCYKVCISGGYAVSDHTAQVLQYVMIGYTLLSLPASISLMKGTEGLRLGRIIILGVGLIGAVICFYFTRINSLIWIAGILAIGLVLCKPRKAIEEEIPLAEVVEDETENAETENKEENN